jgi:hypothetical protein
MMNICTAMTPDTLYRLAPFLIALQFAAFGWRVNRELSCGDADRGTFVLIPDVLNIMSLFAAVTCLIVLPIAIDTYFWLSRMVLAGGYVLIAFHPFTVAAHYRLWSREGIRRHVRDGQDYPYATTEELISSSLSVVLSVSAAAYIGIH